MVSLDQFRETYLTECTELLAEMEERLVALTPETADSEMLNAIFRCAHSIKGGSGAFGFDTITSFTHGLESLLDVMREGKVQPTREVVDILLKSVDIVTLMVSCAKQGTPVPAETGADVLVNLKKIAAGSQEQNSASAETKAPAMTKDEGPVHFWQIGFMAHENLFASGNEPLLILREVARLGNVSVVTQIHRIPPLESINPEACYLAWSIRLETTKPESAVREIFEFVEDDCDLTITIVEDIAITASIAVEEDEAPKATMIAQTATEEQNVHTATTTSIRVDLEKVDRLVNMVGELVITEAMLRNQTRGLAALEEFSGLVRGIDDLSQHMRELQEAVMAVRMQPVKSIFSRMPRIVRDLSGQLGKDIRLETSGENTEVDKTVVEQLSDPLMHMIRNSIDHGIETPEQRVKAGKPAQGVIHLSADHRSGRIVITIEDDGAGINRPKVLAKAQEKGLIPADAVLTDEECDNLIFLPGFSTADVVSNISGRGVGMDVVRRNIRSLEGTVRIKTEPGKGSMFIVSLPLTLAILDGMIVRVGAENYIIPITSIIETLRPKKDEVRCVEGHSDVINVRGEFVPIIYLHRIFQVAGAINDPSKALIVLVESGRQKMGVVVDELIGQQQVVVKSLEANTDPVKGVSGATILGDGRVSLILEINDLGQLCRTQPQTEVLEKVA
jgi:two-component system chemotaxis sensor kinase CheA